MSTTVDTVPAGSAAILRIHGEITGGSEGPLMAAYGGVAPGVRSIVLDFGDLEYMNSGGIGLLVTSQLLLVTFARLGPESTSWVG